MPRVAILMPQLGESIAEAEVRHIHIGVGDSVDADQEIIEVETNKAVMEVTTLHKDSGEFDTGSLQQIAEEESDQPVEWSGVTLGEFRGVTGSCTEEDVAIREWYVANGAMMLFITYSCEEENRGMDDAAVDELLDTLLLTGQSTQAGPVRK